MLYNFQFISFAKFRHMAILAVFCGYFGYFAIMNPKYFEPKLVPNCCPKGTWYFPVCHTPCTFIPKLLEVLVQECPIVNVWLSMSNCQQSGSRDHKKLGRLYWLLSTSCYPAWLSKRNDLLSCKLRRSTLQPQSKRLKCSWRGLYSKVVRNWWQVRIRLTYISAQYSCKLYCNV